jgi:molybdopterin-guanine dinucleotide biosynthesis protein A
MTIPLADITGLVLAGGRGSRMGGVDKGLQTHRGLPLVQHALQRLRPQVGGVLVNANCNIATYAEFGAPVVADTLPDQPGPLAGLLAGLEHCNTPYLVSVPCDAPDFPLELVQRLAAALLEDGADLSMACSLEAGVVRRQPVFCLLHAGLRESLRAHLLAGQRKVDGWAARHRCAQVVFGEPAAFFNINTLPELQPAAPGPGVARPVGRSAGP